MLPGISISYGPQISNVMDTEIRGKEQSFSRKIFEEELRLLRNKGRKYS